MYALMSVHTGEVKERGNSTNHINNVKSGNLLTFETRKEACFYIKDSCAWALIPMKVLRRTNTVNGQETYYRFYLNNL